MHRIRKKTDNSTPLTYFLVHDPLVKDSKEKKKCVEVTKENVITFA